jgi:lia operon protein LiaF
MMRNRGQLFIGAVLVVFGLLSLLSTVFHIDFGALCWPVLLIAVGVWLVFRPRLGGPDSEAEVLLLGDRRRRGEWAVRNEEFWLGIGDVELDMTQATIPPGETVLRIYGFVGDVDVFVPRVVGVAVQLNGFVIDSDVLGRDYDSFLSPVSVQSENYTTAESRLRIEMISFVADLKVKHV